MNEPGPTRGPQASRPWWWVFDPRFSLRAFAALLVGLGALLFAALLGWISSRALQRTLDLQLGGSFETLAAQLSDKLDRALFERTRTLQLTAALAPMRAYDTSAADRRRLLSALLDTTPDFVWVGFANPQGRVVAATRGVPEGSSVDSRPWFQQAQERAYAGGPREPRELPDDLFRDDGGEGPLRVIDLAVPVNDPDGRFAGVLAAQLRWTWTRELQLSVIPDSARRERLGVTLYSSDGDVLLDSGGSGWTQPPDAPTLTDARRYRGHFVEPTLLGTTYLTGFARSRGHRDFRGLGWVTAVRQPVEQAFAPVTSLRHSIVGWGLLLTVLATFGAWRLAGRISRRLHSVGLAAERIHSGDVLATLPTGRGEGELERMCHSLWRLVEKLRPPPDRTPPPPDVRPPRKDFGPVV